MNHRATPRADVAAAAGPRSRPLWPHLLAVTLAAAALALLAHRQAPDTERYLTEARSLLAHGIFSLDGQTPTLRDVPGFPLLLALFLRLGGLAPEQWCALLNAVCLGLIAAGTARAVRVLAPPPPDTADTWLPVLAVYATALYPSLLGSTLFALTELPYTALWLWSNLLLLDAGRHRAAAAARRGAAAGALLAAACYLRPVGLLFPPLALGAALLSARRHPGATIRSALGHTWPTALAYAAALFVLVLPWSWRNQRVSGRWHPLAAGAGMHLYIGASQEWRGAYPDFEPVVTLMSQGLTHADADRELGRQALAAIGADPGAWLGLMPAKLARLWLDVPGSKRQIRSRALLLGLYGFQTLAVAATVLGLLHLRRHPAFAWVLAPLLYTMLFHLVLFAMARFRVPVEPYAIIAIILSFRERWQARGIARLAGTRARVPRPCLGARPAAG